MKKYFLRGPICTFSATAWAGSPQEGAPPVPEETMDLERDPGSS